MGRDKTVEELVNEISEIIEKFKKETSFSILGLKLNGIHTLMFFGYGLLSLIFR